MNVKDLITELLDCDLDATVDIEIESTQEDDTSQDFDLVASGRYLSLVVKLKDYVLVSKSDYENTEKEIESLENQIAELEESK